MAMRDQNHSTRRAATGGDPLPPMEASTPFSKHAAASEDMTRLPGERQGPELRGQEGVGEAKECQQQRQQSQSPQPQWPNRPYQRDSRPVRRSSSSNVGGGPSSTQSRFSSRSLTATHPPVRDQSGRRRSNVEQGADSLTTGDSSSRYIKATDSSPSCQQHDVSTPPTPSQSPEPVVVAAPAAVMKHSAIPLPHSRSSSMSARPRNERKPRTRSPLRPAAGVVVAARSRLSSPSLTQTQTQTQAQAQAQAQRGESKVRRREPSTVRGVSPSSSRQRYISANSAALSTADSSTSNSNANSNANASSNSNSNGNGISTRSATTTPTPTAITGSTSTSSTSSGGRGRGTAGGASRGTDSTVPSPSTTSSGTSHLPQRQQSLPPQSQNAVTSGPLPGGSRAGSRRSSSNNLKFSSAVNHNNPNANASSSSLAASGPPPSSSSVSGSALQRTAATADQRRSPSSRSQPTTPTPTTLTPGQTQTHTQTQTNSSPAPTPPAHTSSHALSHYNQLLQQQAQSQSQNYASGPSTAAVVRSLNEASAHNSPQGTPIPSYADTDSSSSRPQQLHPAKSSTSMVVKPPATTTAPSAPASVPLRQNLPSTATSAATHHPPADSATTIPGRGEEGNPVTIANMSSKRQNNGLHSATSFHDLSPANTYDVPEMTDLQPRPPRGLLRGASVSGPLLETVQEGVDSSSLPQDMREGSNDIGPESKPSTVASSTTSRADKESGSESGGNVSQSRHDGRRSSKQRTPSTIRKPGDIISKRSFASLPPAKGKCGEATPRNMIVEAETVSSVPQVSLGVGQGDRDRSMPNRADAGGVLRPRASEETIRPKKKEKKPLKSSRVVPAATGASKSDFFEYKVKTAVDEADSSDSAETFVYDSNPADPTISLPPQPNMKPRYHSRTPSVTSTTSQADQYIGRPRPAPPHNLSGKRSMKFTNNNGGYGGTLDVDVSPDMNGAGGGSGSAGGSSARTSMRNSRGHLHSSRQYRPNMRHTVYTPSLEPLAFHAAAKQSRHNISSNGRRSTSHLRGTNKSRDEAFVYDFDGDGADDERAPLLSSIRSGRYRHGRRLNPASLRRLEYIETRGHGWRARYGFCATLLTALFIIIASGILILVELSKPLHGVSVMGIENVIASEQAIMLDIDVQAINPNIMSLTVSRVDVNVFAKSKFIGNDNLFPELALSNADLNKSDVFNAQEFHTSESVDEGTNPMPDPDDTPADNSSTMLLGRVFYLNAPLTFDPSPWHQSASSSIGQIRLAHPGNKTEEGGTKRWERVLQHPFELILRGVVHYQLPIGSRYTSAPISGRVDVVPGNEEAN